MKQCNVEGCIAYVFSRGLCIKHWKQKYQKPIPISLKKNNKITPKRKKLTKDYHDTIKHLDSISNKHMCFFCGKEIKGVVSHHHLKGRDGDLLVDSRYIVPSHNSCHVEEYHQRSVTILVTYPWYNDFLYRIKEIDFDLWKRELRKQVKANIMPIEQYNFLTS